MRKAILFNILFFIFINSYSQAPSIQWQKSLGGSLLDLGLDIQLTTDGGYIIAASSDSNNGDVSGNKGMRDYWIVKIDVTGVIQWQKSLGGSNDDIVYSIQQTTDGGYIVSGWSVSNDGDVSGNHGGNDYWIVKLNSAGGIQWQKSLGSSGTDYGRDIKQTTDGGYIVTGVGYNNDGDITGALGFGDTWVVKLSSTGIIQWQKSLGGTATDQGFAISLTNDGGYILTGYTYSNDLDVSGNHGGADIWVTKIDALGSVDWQKTLGGTLDDKGMQIQQTADLGYIVLGNSSSNDGDVTGNHGGDDFWVVKLNNTGAIQWEHSYGGTSAEAAKNIKQTVDGGYIISGYSSSNNGDVSGNKGASDYWLLKIDSSGLIEWQKMLGGTNTDFGGVALPTLDGGYIQIGNSSSNNIDVSGNHGSADCWVVKLNFSSDVSAISRSNELLIFPNPNNGNFSFINIEDVSTIEIYDISGRVIFQATTKDTSYSIDLSENSRGIYFYRVTNDKNVTQTGKIILN